MRRYTQGFPKLYLLVATILLMYGCSSLGSTPPLPFSTINTSEELPSNLFDIQLIFSRNQNDETSVHISTLERDEKTTITLQNEGDGVNKSPDGLYLVYRFGETVEGEYHSGIWIHDIFEEVERKVILWPEEYTTVHVNNPSFFPDEEKLIFSITWFEDDTIGLATVKMDGSDFQIIDTPQGKLNEGPIVSPDGKRILVLCEGIDSNSGQPGFMLCIMNSDGSERILLTKSGSYHGTYLFSPDSQSIIYSEAEWGGLIGLIDKPYYQIRRIDIDGKNLHTILDWHRAINDLPPLVVPLSMLVQVDEIG